MQEIMIMRRLRPRFLLLMLVPFLVSGCGLDQGSKPYGDLLARRLHGYEHRPYFPAQPPPGYDPQGAPLLVGFPEPGGGKSTKVWVTLYSIDVLPPAVGDVGGYRLVQSSADSAEYPSCGANYPASSVLHRQMSDAKLTICLGPNPTEAAKFYLANATLTKSLKEIEWLKNEGEASI